MLDDPRVDVRVLQAGEPAPHDGVWMNRWAFDALIETAKAPGEPQRHRGTELNPDDWQPGNQAEGYDP